MTAVSDAHAVVEPHHVRQTGFEVFEVLLLRTTPLHLADGIETGQEHIKQVLRR